METLESLYNKKQYTLIIDLTKNSNNTTNLMYRINSFIALNDIGGAISCFDEHLEQMYNELSLYTVNTYFNLLFRNDNFEKASKMIKVFKEFKYISQEIEEIIEDYSNQLSKPTKKREFYDIDSIFEKLNSSKSELEKIDLLHKLKNLDITDYVVDIVNLTKSDASDFFKTFSLLLLVNNKINVEFEYTNSLGTYNVNPIKLTPPFTDHFYSLIHHFVEKNSNDPSMNRTLFDLLDQFILAIYPIAVDKYIMQPSHVAIVFLALAHEYMAQEFNWDLLDKYELDRKNFDDYIKKVSQILTSVHMDLKN